MGYPVTKLIIDGEAHQTVGSAVLALLNSGKTPNEVYAHFGGKTPSLQSAVSSAKKKLGINKSVPKISAKSSPVAVSKNEYFCVFCGSPAKGTVFGVGPMEGVKNNKVTCTVCARSINFVE